MFVADETFERPDAAAVLHSRIELCAGVKGGIFARISFGPTSRSLPDSLFAPENKAAWVSSSH
jgi:hypothetical protein